MTYGVNIAQFTINHTESVSRMVTMEKLTSQMLSSSSGCVITYRTMNNR